jgi:hypothetical protein
VAARSARSRLHCFVYFSLARIHRLLRADRFCGFEVGLDG